jgi:hypothetical protein
MSRQASRSHRTAREAKRNTPSLLAIEIDIDIEIAIRHSPFTIEIGV